VEGRLVFDSINVAMFVNEKQIISQQTTLDHSLKRRVERSAQAR
jgi:hypothetical protein